jgi:hypothetical protein
MLFSLLILAFQSPCLHALLVSFLSLLIQSSPLSLHCLYLGLSCASQTAASPCMLHSTALDKLAHFVTHHCTVLGVSCMHLHGLGLGWLCSCVHSVLCEHASVISSCRGSKLPAEAWPWLEDLVASSCKVHVYRSVSTNGSELRFEW